MSPKLTRKIVAHLTEDIAVALSKAGALAGAARDAADSGHSRQAVETLLELEPLLWDARGLINAATLLHHRAREQMTE